MYARHIHQLGCKTDSPGEGAACGTSYCAQQADAGFAFCNDFDEGSLPWNMTPLMVVGDVVLSATQAEALSCTSLQAHVPRQTGAPPNGSDPHAFLETIEGRTNPSVTVDLDVRLPDLGGAAQEDGFVFFGVYANDPGWEIHLEHHGGGIWVLVVHQGIEADGGLPIEKSMTINPIVDQWTHMTLTVTFAGPGATATGQARLDYVDPDAGMTSTTVATNNLATLGEQVTQVHLDLGAEIYTVTSADYDVCYDNAVIH